MKQINNCWVDGNSNRWNCNFYTKEQATKESESLKNCSDCSNCSNFETNPQRITSSNIGSRNSQSTYYWTNDKEQIICGCYKGILSEFEERVKKVHSGTKYEKEYLEWIQKIKLYKS